MMTRLSKTSDPEDQRMRLSGDSTHPPRQPLAGGYRGAAEHPALPVLPCLRDVVVRYVGREDVVAKVSPVGRTTSERVVDLRALAQRWNRLAERSPDVRALRFGGR